MTRTHIFISFFAIVLTLYFLLNTYIYIRGLQAFPHGSASRVWYIVIFWFLAVSYIVARVLERFAWSRWTDALVWIGSCWLGVMIYFVLILLCLDLLRGLHVLIPFFPHWITQYPAVTRKVLAAAITGFVCLAATWMWWNAAHPRIQTLDLTIPKHSSLKSLNIVMASDLHMGTIISNGRLTRIVDSINALHPDLVLFVGDLVDEDIQPVIRENLGETLKQLRSTYGVYAVTGNHEYIGGVEAACRYLTAHGITMLRDQSITIADAIVLIGREDVSANRMNEKQRKSLSELLAGVDTTLPLLLMDHQPFHLVDAQEHGIDLQLSGHTHHGQLWPFNYLTEAIYEKSWGYLQKGKTQYYVSCGVGTWGPPMRSGNRPEIVAFHLQFK
jgi:predicted MPP superfamily phosphohydrolase